MNLGMNFFEDMNLLKLTEKVKEGCQTKIGIQEKEKDEGGNQIRMI